MEKLLIFLHCVTAFKDKYHIKIKHKSPNETVLNEFSITLDKMNKDISSDNIEISKPKLVKNIDYMNLRKDNSVFYNNDIVPIKRNHEEIKQDLDQFIIQRKRSHITTVQFNFNIPVIHKEIRSYDKAKIYLKDTMTRQIIKETDEERNSFNMRERHKNKVNVNEKSDVNRTQYIRKLEKNKISQDIVLNDMFKQKEMQEILKKQNMLVDRLAKFLKQEKKTLRTDFHTLLDDMENLKNETVTWKQEVIQGFIPPATVVNIDETAVREALKKDPLIKRVLEMGQRKRNVYVKEAKIYNKMLI